MNAYPSMNNLEDIQFGATVKIVPIDQMDASIPIKKCFVIVV